MKKLLTILLAVLMVLGLAGCGEKPEKKSEGVMTYAEYDEVVPDNKTKVTIEGYVQAVQSYWNGATMYLADKDGAYFAYNSNISEEDYAKLGVETNFANGWTGLANGTKVKVVGYKTEWEGEVEIGDIESVSIVDDSKWLAKAKDVTKSFADQDALKKYNNQLVMMKGLKVTEAALYNYNGSGKKGANSDLYYKVSDGTATYSFTVESYLCYEDSDVYNTVLGLQVGDTVDLEGFMYWYQGPQLHTTKVTVK